MTGRTLFVVIASDGTAWVSEEPVEGRFPATVVHTISPGESVEGVPFHAWRSLMGEAVNLAVLQRELGSKPLSAVVEEAIDAQETAELALSRGFLGWFIIAGAAAIVVSGIGGLVTQSRAFATYRPVTAVVTDVDLDTRRSRWKTWYSPSVRYEYEIEGTRYHGSQFRRKSPWYQDSRAARKLTVGYQPGQRVTVYVDPHNVARSFLRREASPSLVWAPVALLALCGFMYWFIVMRHRRRGGSLPRGGLDKTAAA